MTVPHLSPLASLKFLLCLETIMSKESYCGFRTLVAALNLQPRLELSSKVVVNLVCKVLSKIYKSYKGEGENLLDQLKSDINHTWVRRFLIHEPLHYDLVNVKVISSTHFMRGTTSR